MIFQIEEVEDLVVDVNTGQEPPILCFGECNGFIDISVSGGTAPYSFLWSNGETTEDLSDLCPGFYSVTITDSNGCCEIIERTIEEVPEIEILIDSFTENLDCFGDCNGQINIDVSGGNQPYSFFWFGPDGFFSNDEDLTPEDPYNELGFGFKAWFNMLWTFIILFSLFTIIMLPALFIYGRTDGLYVESNAAKTSKAKYSLGNLGFSGSTCIS